MNFAEEVTDTEDDADDESLGTDEETRVEKQFVCQVESCDFSHRSEWGIKKHCMVSSAFHVFSKSSLSPSLEYFNPFCDT
jgi:hypothetical protein